MTIHLLDYLAYKLHCDNVSDISDIPRYKLYYQINKIPSEQCIPDEWAYAAKYLFGVTSESETDCEKLKNVLLENVKYTEFKDKSHLPARHLFLWRKKQ